MIGSSVDVQTVKACKIARAINGRHLTSDDIRNGTRGGLAPGDPRRGVDREGYPLISRFGAKMKPGFSALGFGSNYDMGYR